jgi:hypothetical protein
MPTEIIGVVWAFCWGVAAASGSLIRGILGLITKLRHRSIAASMSFGPGVLLSAASFKVAPDGLILADGAATVGGNPSWCRYVQHHERGPRHRE